MKHQKKKFLILALASVLGAATLGGGALTAMADDTTDTPAPALYSATDVFSTSSASLDTAGTYLSFNMKDDGKVTLSQRSLAWKWFAKNEA